MNSNKRYIIAVIAIILIVVGGVGGYISRDFFNATQKTTQETVSVGGKKDVPLTANRDTAIVEAVKKAGPSIVGITTKVYQRDFFNQQVSW